MAKDKDDTTETGAPAETVDTTAADEAAAEAPAKATKSKKEAANPHADLIARIDTVLPNITRGDWQIRDLLVEAREALS